MSKTVEERLRTLGREHGWDENLNQTSKKEKAMSGMKSTLEWN